MASETSIICKDIKGNVDDYDFEIIKGVYFFHFHSDLTEMRDFLEICKVSADVRDINLSCTEPILNLVDHLQIKSYLIQYNHDFAGIPDKSGFTVPVKNGIILNRYISDEEDYDERIYKQAYKSIGIDYPLFF